jgi:hypothetical protein
LTIISEDNIIGVNLLACILVRALLVQLIAVIVRGILIVIIALMITTIATFIFVFRDVCFLLRHMRLRLLLLILLLMMKLLLLLVCFVISRVGMLRCGSGPMTLLRSGRSRGR